MPAGAAAHNRTGGASIMLTGREIPAAGAFSFPETIDAGHVIVISELP